MRQLRRMTLLAVGGLLLWGCSDPLEVENRNNPDRGAVLRLPRDLEALTGRLYQNVHTAVFGSTTALYPQLMVLGLENVSSLNNNGMGPRGGIPRNFIDNVPGGVTQDENRRDFSNLQQTARTAMDIMFRLNAPDFTIGTVGEDKRARMFTWFGYGTALGNTALMYDSLAIPPLEADPNVIPPLIGYDQGMAEALVGLDSALALANDDQTAFPIPGAWLAQKAPVSKARFIEVARAYKARFRAGMARTPEERAAVDWAAVVDDATNGLKSDLVLDLAPSAGWNNQWIVQMYTTGAANWHQMPQLMIGMADTSGAYDAWLALQRDVREPFLIVTPDLRFPRGTTRAEQQANSPDILTGIQYIRNRPTGDDQPGPGWGRSFYSHHRWRALHQANRVGPWVTFSQAENDMLAAEGYIRLGEFANAATLIDRWRSRAGLPSVAGLTALGQPVPGGTVDAPVPGSASCVPRVPDPAAGFAASKCGDIMEAMKWEKRMESAYSSYGTWYTDGRGWGDLPEGTVINYPVPWQELDARQLPHYLLGGVGLQGGAAASQTYGFGSGTQ